MKLRLSSTACALMVSMTLGAYEVQTHAAITEVAYQRSVASTAEWRARIGLDRLESNAPLRPWFGPCDLLARDLYLDLAGTWSPAQSPLPWLRPAHAFEADRIGHMQRLRTGAVDGHEPTRVQGWLMRGVIREDDLTRREYPAVPVPDRDPHGELNRSIHHFYDPVSNTTFPPAPIVGTPIRSVDWTLGVEDALAPSFNPLLSRRNHYSWVDARRHLWLGLTYKPQPGMGEADGRAAQLRLVFLATSLKALGQVLHHLQDAAQPQHSRKDAHNHSYDWRFAPFNASVARRTYEVFTEFRATGGFQQDDPFLGPVGEEQTFADLFGTSPEVGNRFPPWTSDYPIPKFATPIEFLTTRHIDSQVLDRRGMADYSNRGFFSEGTLPRAISGFAHPPDDLDGPGYTVVERQGTLPDGRPIRFRDISREVPDTLAPHLASVLPLGSVGVFRAFRQNAPMYIGSISLANYADMADNLVPRAAAYSAGMIDYFFRGRIEIAAPSNGLVSLLDHAAPHYTDADGYPRRLDDHRIFGFETLRLLLRNASGYFDGEPVESMAGGEVVVVAQYHRNLCYEPDLSREPARIWPSLEALPGDCPPGMSRSDFPEISVSAPVAVAGNLDGAFQQISFNFSADPVPVNATDLILRVVYRGHLGSEQQVGLAVGVLDVKEPSYFGLINAMDYAWWNGQWWRPDVLAQQPGFNGNPTPLPINDFGMAFGGATQFTGTGLTVEGFFRIAAILGPDGAPNVSLQMRFGTGNLFVLQQAWPGSVRQAAMARLGVGVGYSPDPILLFRGLPGGDAFRWGVRAFSTPGPTPDSYLELDPLTPMHDGLYLPEPGTVLKAQHTQAPGPHSAAALPRGPKDGVLGSSLDDANR
jgi:hypothetical protein